LRLLCCAVVGLCSNAYACGCFCCWTELVLEQSQTCARASGDSTPLLRRVSGFWLSKRAACPRFDSRTGRYSTIAAPHPPHPRAVVDALPHWAGGCGGSGCCSQLANQSAGRPELPAFRPPPGGEAGFYGISHFAINLKWEWISENENENKMPRTQYALRSG